MTTHNKIKITSDLLCCSRTAVLRLLQSSYNLRDPILFTREKDLHPLSLASRISHRASRANLRRLIMETESEQQQFQTQWWHKYRWRQTSHAEAIADERSLLDLANTPLEAKDVAFGPGKDEFMHTISGGFANTASPQLVYVPGYGAGSGFIFRVIQGLSAGFRMFAGRVCWCCWRRLFYSLSETKLLTFAN